MLEVVLAGIDKVRADIKSRLSDGLLAGLERASQEVADTLSDQLERYKRRTAQTLGDLDRKCNKIVVDLKHHSVLQAEEIERLNCELLKATVAASEETTSLLKDGLEKILREEEQQAERARKELLEQFQQLMAKQEVENNERLFGKIATLRESFTEKQNALTGATNIHNAGVAALLERQKNHVNNTVPGLQAELSSELKNAGDTNEAHVKELSLIAGNLRSGFHVAAEEQIAELDNTLFALDEVATSVTTHSTQTTSTSRLTCTRMAEYIQDRLGVVRKGVAGAAEETEALGAAVAGYSTRTADSLQDLKTQHAVFVSDARKDATDLEYHVSKHRPVLFRPMYPRELPTTFSETAVSRQSTILIDEEAPGPVQASSSVDVNNAIIVNEDEEVPAQSTIMKDMPAHEPLQERSPLSDISKNENAVDSAAATVMSASEAAPGSIIASLSHSRSLSELPTGSALTSNLPVLVSKLREPLKRRRIRVTSPVRKRQRGAADH